MKTLNELQAFVYSLPMSHPDRQKLKNLLFQLAYEPEGSEESRRLHRLLEAQITHIRKDT